MVQKILKIRRLVLTLGICQTIHSGAGGGFFWLLSNRPNIIAEARNLVPKRL